MQLHTVWFVIVAFFWVGFFVLEGFDFGVGMLHAIVGRTESQRRAALGTIGPFWDGNEVWLVVAGAGTFAAFPGWYATMFSSLYLALLVVLAALMARGVGIEYGGKSDNPRWRSTWKWCTSIGSLLIPLLIGVGLGDLLAGLPINQSHDFTGNFFDLLTPYGLWTGLTFLGLCLLHGATFLKLKGTDAVRERARALARPLGLAAVALVVGFVIWTLSVAGGADVPDPVQILAVIAVIFAARLALSEAHDGAAFSAAAIAIAAAVGSIFIHLYPNVMISSTNAAYNLTVNNSASGSYALKVMTVVAVILLPVVLLYQSWSFHVFRARVTAPRRSRSGAGPGGRSADAITPAGSVCHPNRVMTGGARDRSFDPPNRPRQIRRSGQRRTRRSHMAAVVEAQKQGGTNAETSDRTADVFVAFGITGDLAKVMTFRSLYRLERRGLLNCPVLGVSVDDWTVDHLRAHARSAIEGTGEKIDEAIFDRLAARLSYVRGDFGDADTYKRVGEAIGPAQRPVFYLEIPPFLFGAVIKGLSEAGLTKTARVVVEKPFGHDLASAHALAQDIHQYIDESQLYRIDHYLGKMGLQELLYLRFANSMLEPVWNRDHISSVQITMAEDFGVEDRGHFYDRVGALQDVVVNHLMQVVAMAAMEAPAGADAGTLKDAKFAVFRSMADADPDHYVRGQYDGYLGIDGVADGSTTETYAALRLEIDNWRWAGVPFFIRAGKRLPVTQTELRLVFRRPPRLGFLESTNRPPAEGQLIVKLDPATGVRLEIDAHRADKGGAQMITLDMEFADEGGEGPTPYEVLLQAAMEGDSTPFTRQDSVEETWRIMAPLLEAPPPAHPYAPGSWGPEAADHLLAGRGRWHDPWVAR